MIMIKANRGNHTIDIGRQFENDVRVVRFHFSDWKQQLGEGVANLTFQRPEDDAPYAVALDQGEDYADWTVMLTDVQQVGTGEAQLTYVINEQIAKSEIYTVKIDRSLGEAAEPVTPAEQNYLDKIIQEGATAQRAALEATTQAGNAKDSADNAATSEENASTSELNAQGSAEAAEQYESNASTSAQNAKTSEDNAKTSETAAEKSEGFAAASEANARASENAAKKSAEAAKTSEDKARTHEANARESADKASAAVVNAPKIISGTWWVWDFQHSTYVNTGVSAKGQPGEGFSITKIYPSIAAMNADFNNAGIKYGAFVLITTEDVNDPDNSKIYIKGRARYEYLNDLSGAQGIQGPSGKSAYDIAVEHGFEGTEQEWLDSLKANAVPDGGTTGQVLTKRSDADGDAIWATPTGGGGTGGGTAYNFDEDFHTAMAEDGSQSVSLVKAESVQSDNTHPITSAAVYTEVGNINALLSTI